MENLRQFTFTTKISQELADEIKRRAFVEGRTVSRMLRLLLEKEYNIKKDEN